GRSAGAGHLAIRTFFEVALRFVCRGRPVTLVVFVLLSSGVLVTNAGGTVVIRHGTTLHRAQQLLRAPPDPDYIEPGGNHYTRAGGFSTDIAGQSAASMGSAEQYARAKAANFPSEGGPAILEVEVPERIVDIL